MYNILFLKIGNSSVFFQQIKGITDLSHLDILHDLF